ncbi:MAG: cupin domain-containing protein [Candidatus Bathyarchaeia archaeon]
MLKVFSVYDNNKPLEELVKEEEFFGILYANTRYFKPGEDEGVHSHENHLEVYIFFQGKGTAITENGDINVTRGDVLVFESGEGHGFESDNIDTLAYLCIGIRIK